jgi:hypothetical protein
MNLTRRAAADQAQSPASLHAGNRAAGGGLPGYGLYG